VRLLARGISTCVLVLAAVALSAGSAVAFTPTISEFSTGLNPDAGPVGIAAGPDGNLWFADLACATAKAPGACAIGEINPTTHAISEFSTGLNSVGIPAVIAPGPDGNLWFTEGPIPPDYRSDYRRSPRTTETPVVLGVS
jgi:streptogramin lyase